MRTKLAWTNFFMIYIYLNDCSISKGSTLIFFNAKLLSLLSFTRKTYPKLPSPRLLYILYFCYIYKRNSALKYYKSITKYYFKQIEFYTKDIEN